MKVGGGLVGSKALKEKRTHFKTWWKVKMKKINIYKLAKKEAKVSSEWGKF